MATKQSTKVFLLMVLSSILLKIIGVVLSVQILILLLISLTLLLNVYVIHIIKDILFLLIITIFVIEIVLMFYLVFHGQTSKQMMEKITLLVVLLLNVCVNLDILGWEETSGTHMSYKITHKVTAGKIVLLNSLLVNCVTE